HNVVARELVDNFVPVIRRQLATWVSEPNVDVVIVLGGTDDGVTASALAPLVTLALPGFGDVFRWLMFQEHGSAAVLANAEAARCSSTFMFVLPAAPDASRIALERLV